MCVCTKGLILDLTSRQPKVIALLGGSAQSMDISIPGKEPDIMARDIDENVVDVLGSDIYDKAQRRKRLGDPSIASTYEYDTDHVYTFVSGNIPLWCLLSLCITH